MNEHVMLGLLIALIVFGVLERLEHRYGALTGRQPGWTKGRVSQVWDYRTAFWRGGPHSQAKAVRAHNEYLPRQRSSKSGHGCAQMREGVSPLGDGDATGFPS